MKHTTPGEQSTIITEAVRREGSVRANAPPCSRTTTFFVKMRVTERLAYAWYLPLSMSTYQIGYETIALQLCRHYPELDT